MDIPIDILQKGGIEVAKDQPHQSNEGPGEVRIDWVKHCHKIHALNRVAHLFMITLDEGTRRTFGGVGVDYLRPGQFR